MIDLKGYGNKPAESEDQSQQYTLRLRQMNGGFQIRGISRGDGLATDEEIAAELHKMLDRIERGEAKPVESIDGYLFTDTHV